MNFDGFTDVFVVGGDGTLNYFINSYPDLKYQLQSLKGELEMKPPKCVSMIHGNENSGNHPIKYLLLGNLFQGNY